MICKMAHNDCYTKLNINERINAKSWVDGITNGQMHHLLHFCLEWKNLPPKLAENIGEPYTKEALLHKRNWMLYRM